MHILRCMKLFYKKTAYKKIVGVLGHNTATFLNLCNFYKHINFNI